MHGQNHIKSTELSFCHTNLCFLVGLYDVTFRRRL